MLDEGLRALVAQYGVGGPRKSGVLLVDDERPNLLVLRGFLESGYTVYEAESGKQALEIADKTDLDVVIADQRNQPRPRLPLPQEAVAAGGHPRGGAAGLRARLPVAHHPAAGRAARPA